MVGINVDQLFAETQRKGLLHFGDDERAKADLLKWFIQDIREAKYSEQVEKGVLQFLEDMISGMIEVRAHNSKAIHAKFYLFLPEQHTSHSDGWVIMGSSNLTEAGLGVKRSPNYELNIALKDYDDVKFTRDEFESLWKESTPVLPADIQQFKEKTHIGQVFTPFELYIKFLIEYFGKNIDYDPDTVGDLPTTYKKLSYQIDAVNEGFQMLMEHNGFFLADVVGLGKTVVAAMIAKRFLIANGTQNSKILVVYPPALEKNWKDTFRQFGIDRHTKFITNGRLDKIADGKSIDYWPKEDYDLILVDEAHRYRNHTSIMFDNLQRICKASRNGEGLIAGEKKKVILISATPLNNRPQDLYYQLLLFQDARRSTLTETNLQTFFGPIIREYRDIITDENPDLNRIREIYELIREKVISPITVRRTRKDLEKYPKYKDDLKAQGIDFPAIAAPRSKNYALEGELGVLFADTMVSLTTEVKYHRYQAISSLKEDIRGDLYPQAKLVSASLARILQTLMVKRLDPAIGSGAFPMGLLKEIFECRRVLFEFLKTNENFSAAEIKKEIIQNNIYGVDAEPGAVDIARLRFWLALVVNEEEPTPLPNLDYKIMQGNSLLERFDDIDLSRLVSADEQDEAENLMIIEQRQLGFDEGHARLEQPQFTVTVFDAATKEGLQKLIEIYFDPEEHQRKTGEKHEKSDLKTQINNIVEGKVHAHIFTEKNRLEAEVRKYEKKWVDASVLAILRNWIKTQTSIRESISR
ncbi:MAG TPA: SNF2-related protein [Pyrinomonadaceae bacterium]|nr:SNF2-related protein [Pyrinomonadaceae bacterium]